MKALLISISVFLVTTIAKAKTSPITDLDSSSQLEEPCGWRSPSNSTESYTGSLNGNIFANDFQVTAGTQFVVNRLKVNIVSPYYSNPDFIGGAITFYENNISGVGLGNLIGWMTIVATSYTYLGNYNESGNLKVYEFIFDFDSIQFDGGIMGENFWLAFTVGNGTWEIPEFWETKSVMNSQNGIYVNYALGDGFESYIQNMENVFELSGVCNTLDVPEVEASEISVFPNPVKDVLSISYSDSKSLTAMLTNISGQELTNTIDRNIDMSQYPTGLYFLQLTDPITGKSQIEKILKN